MKVGLTCPASLPATQFGGIMFLCLDIAKELAKKNIEMIIYTTDLDFANNPKTFNKSLPRIEIIDNFKICRTHVLFSIGLFYVNPSMIFQILKDKPDIIHAIGVRSFQALIATIVSKLKKIPLVISDQGGLTTHPYLREGRFLQRILSRIQTPMLKFIINQSARVIVANEYEKKIFLNFCDSSKITIVRNGINLDSIKNQPYSFREKYHIAGQFVLFLGRFDKIKGIDVLLKAFNLIKNRDELANTMLVIMGVDFGFEKQMEQLIEKLDLGEKVLVIKKPSRNDVIAAYQECKFLVLPSRWELSPLTPLEAFVFKKAVISTTAHGIPHTLMHDKNAILVEPENHDSLSKAILNLIIDEKKCNELGICGFDMVTSICNSKIMAENILKIYQEIIKR